MDQKLENFNNPKLNPVQVWEGIYELFGNDDKGDCFVSDVLTLGQSIPLTSKDLADAGGGPDLDCTTTKPKPSKLPPSGGNIVPAKVRDFPFADSPVSSGISDQFVAP